MPELLTEKGRHVMARTDPHSYTDPEHGCISDAHLTLEVDFKARCLKGNVILTLDKPSSGVLHLDTRDLHIEKVVSDKGVPVVWTLVEKDKILGSCLALALPEGTKNVVISYSTSSNASALQWLLPAQTAGKKYPYMFSQCQAIHARSIVPVQDSPSVRFQYSAEITVPKPLSAVMSAELTDQFDSPGSTTTYMFEMPQPIPAYLLALAVGNIHFKDVGPRSRVYTEPEMLEKAAWEFAEIEKMIQAGEEIFGHYRWERYDMLVMPPSFPYGGMENPRLSFFTPTMITGDRSEIHVLPHELSHAWTGNLVTNATMDDFWLNEGLTMWGERRILGVVMGQEYTTLNCALGRRALEEDLKRFTDTPELTKLKTNLKGLDPDEVFSRVPYEKGFLFVVFLEQVVGREPFDTFMRAYMDRFAFQSITSEDFLAFFDEYFPELVGDARIREWIYEPGLRDDAPTFYSEILEEIQRIAYGWNSGVRPNQYEQKRWSPITLQVYLKDIPWKLSHEDCKWLDETFGLNNYPNPEVRALWFRKAAASGYELAFPAMKEFLRTVGRFYLTKYIYKALSENEQTRERAHAWYAEFKDGYHPITRQIIERVLGKR